MKQVCSKCNEITKHKVSTGGFKCSQCGWIDRYSSEEGYERAV